MFVQNKKEEIWKKKEKEVKMWGWVEYGRDMRVEFEKPIGRMILFCWELEMYFYRNVVFKPKGIGVFLNHKIDDPKQGKPLK